MASAGNNFSRMKTLRNAWAWLTRESGMRFLARRRAACAVAVATMGLALGANTVVFAIVKAFVLAGFGLPDPGRLFVVAPVRDLPGRGEVVFAEAYANYARLREAQRSFSDVAVMLGSTESWDTGEEAMAVQAARVSASFFPTTGVVPVLGRPFTTDEEGPGAAPVLIISHALWQSALGGDPAVLGRSQRINGVPHTIVGVMPAGFSHPLPTDAWLPFDLASPAAWTAVTGARNLTVYGRLAAGVSLEAARADMDGFTLRAIEATPDNRTYRYTLQSIRQVLVPGVDRVVWLVQVGALVLVLLAVANVASLLVAWSFDRRSEFAVRRALGAGGARIVVMLIAQAGIVVGLGGLAGLALSLIAVPFLRGLDVSPALSIYFAGLRVDGGVLASSMLVIAGAAVLSGLLPSLLSRRTDPAETLRLGGRSSTSSPAALRAQKGMVVVQTLLSVVLVCGAVVIGASFRNLTRVDTGFRDDDLVVARVQLPAATYADTTARTAFGDRLLENLDRERALGAFGFTSTLPIGDPRWGGRFFIDASHAAGGEEPLLLHIRRVSAGYFETLGIPLLRGRDFDARDAPSGTQVAIISQSLATRLFGDDDPAGRRIFRVRADGDPLPIEIVGVVGDVPDGGLTAPAGETVYVHWRQISVGRMTIVAEPAASTAEALAAIRRALRAADPLLAASDPASLRSLVREANALPRLASLLLGVFAVAALAMVLLGAYGVMSQLVFSREREFAVRMLFGARPAGIATAVLAGAARLVVPGAAAGLAVAWFVGSAIEPLVFGVTPRSPSILATVAALVILLTAIGVLPAARRAATVDIRKGARPG